jgi:cytochrome c-type biogenesis protein CcmF
LRKGESARLGTAEIRFLGFDLEHGGNALAQMGAGEPVTVGAKIEVVRDGTTEQLVPVYRFRSDGRVEFPPVALAGGGRVAVGGINATAGAVELLFEGIGDDTGTPAHLALDVTRKPLVRLVWWGMYVILAGGVLAMLARARQVRKLDGGAPPAAA